MSSRSAILTSIAALMLGACATDGTGDGSVLDQVFDVLDSRDIGEVDRLVAEKSGGHDGQGGVLVARWADASRQAVTALDDVLHGWHVRR